MIIATLTLAGDGSTDIIYDALASTAEWADTHIILDSASDCRLEGPVEDFHDGPGRANSIHRVPYKWPGDFAQARNDLFREAAAVLDEYERQVMWAVTLDADERIHGDMLKAIRDAEARGISCVSVASEDGAYTKPRAFRIPCAEHWEGKTHEAIAISSIVAEGVTFSEIPKSPEQLAAKFTRDLLAIGEMLTENPNNARTWYYAGESCEGVVVHSAKGDDVERLLLRAEAAFGTCSQLSTWDEERAWSRYRQAVVLTRLKKWTEAKVACQLGMLERPDFPEFAWLIGWCELEEARAQTPPEPVRLRRAIVWADLARAVQGQAMAPRIGFRQMIAHYEGPHDVKRWAYRLLGNVAMAQSVDELWLAAKKARIGK